MNLSIPNDFIRLVAERAVDNFGGRQDGMFNAAGFSTSLRKMSGVEQTLDGKMVRAVLAGRPDIEPLAGGCHFRLH